MLKKENWILIILLIVMMLSGCGGDVSEPTPPATATMEAIPPEDTPTPTLPDVVEQGLVVHVSATEPDPAQRQVIEAAATARGLSYVHLTDLNPESAPETMVMVVADTEFPTMAEMVDQMPEVAFVLLGQSSIGEKPNLTVLGGESDLQNTQAFLAGYIAAVESPEYRVGIISTNDPSGQNFRKAFLNGMIYFCGNCAPIYPPYAVYPQFQEVTAGIGQESLENAARAMIAEGVSIMLVSPELQTPEFYAFLVQNGVRLVGTDAPPAGLEGNWIASVLLETGIRLETVLGEILDGNPVSETESRVEISFTGIGAARLQHFNQILTKLLSGEIDPLGEVD